MVDVSEEGKRKLIALDFPRSSRWLLCKIICFCPMEWNPGLMPGKRVTHSLITLLIGSISCSSNTANLFMKLMAATSSTGSEKGSYNNCHSKMVQYQVGYQNDTYEHLYICNRIFFFLYVYQFLYWWIISSEMKWLKIPWRVGCLLFWENNP